MIKIYTLDELKDVNIKAYLKAIRILRDDIGGSSDEAESVIYTLNNLIGELK